MDVNLRLENIEYSDLYCHLFIRFQEFHKNGYYIDPIMLTSYAEATAQNLKKFYQFYTVGEVNQLFNSILSGAINLAENNNSIAKFTPENLMKIFANNYKTCIFKLRAEEYAKNRDSINNKLFAGSNYGKAVLFRYSNSKEYTELNELNEVGDNYKITLQMIVDCLDKNIDPILLINN